MAEQPELSPLLDEAFAGAWARGEAPPALRSRLLTRVAASRAAEAGFTTTRRRAAKAEVLAAGVRVQTLYQGPGQRPGEPLRVRLFELAAGTTLPAALLGSEPALLRHQREWLVLKGDLCCGDEPLGLRDYHVTPAGHATPAWHAQHDALLFLRESSGPHREGDAPFTVRDAEAGWPDFAPGIQRRVLWQHEGQAALLYCAQPGAAVPHHTHGHDEECLMVQGELFLDDVLLQAGDYQLAPAGSGHRLTHTDTGVVIYAHGDLDLQFSR